MQGLTIVYIGFLNDIHSRFHKKLMNPDLKLNSLVGLPFQLNMQMISRQLLRLTRDTDTAVESFLIPDWDSKTDHSKIQMLS